MLKSFKRSEAFFWGNRPSQGLCFLLSSFASKESCPRKVEEHAAEGWYCEE